MISSRPPAAAPADQAAEHPESIAATGAALRAMLRAVASPVVVVTTRTAAGPRGATIGSFTSVSLDPPLVSVNVTHGTQLHAALAEAEGWAVHLLAHDQAALAEHFARPDLDGPAQLAAAPHVAPPDGPPLLRKTLGILLCRPHARFEAGDHTVFVGEVTDLIEGDGTEPLLYFRQSYRGIGSEV